MNLLNSHWLNADGLKVEYANGKMTVVNDSDQVKTLSYPKIFSNNEKKQIYLSFKGKVTENGYSEVRVINRRKSVLGTCLLNSSSNLEFEYLKYYFIVMVIGPKCTVTVDYLRYEEELQDDYISSLKGKDLIIVSDLEQLKGRDLSSFDIVKVRNGFGYAMYRYQGHQVIECGCFELRAVLRARIYENIFVCTIHEGIAAIIDVTDISNTNVCFECDLSVLPDCFDHFREKMSEHKTPFIFDKEVEEPVLSVIVPSYNVTPYLKHNVYSLANQRNAGKVEIIIVNDGSKDETLKMAYELQEKYSNNGRSIVTVVDKENGGHGSTINSGIRIARGKYCKVVDGDDTLDSIGLAEFIDHLEREDGDLILTNEVDDLEKDGMFVVNHLYPNLEEGRLYHFDDLCLAGGFEAKGPTIHTATFRTELARKAGFQISEKSPYVDMELNEHLSIICDTVIYHDINLYKYLIGRMGQSVSDQSYRKNCQKHENICFNMIRIHQENKDNLSPQRNEFIVNKLIIPMLKQQYYIVGDLNNKQAVFNEFDRKLKKYPQFYNDPLLVQGDVEKYRRFGVVFSKLKDIVR